ncbi:helix-turn-helix domain-containing protein [Mesorhizobium amorphae]|uniref:helix-turn-helix domain-containing protein n=1 Tax=Mesorhizobium amorphae TaxID=71433 RepID=UPI0011825032
MGHSSDELALLRAARVLLGLRQDELADRAGVSRQMIVRIENGDLGVSLRTVEKVRTALEIGGIQFVPETDSRTRAIGLTKRDSRRGLPEK